MIQTKCLRCDAAAQQYLCRECVRHTRQTLRGLPRIMRHLAEAAVGQTRLGDIGRHTPYRSRHELDGESELASHIEALPVRDRMGYPNPDDDAADLYESRLARETAARRKLLAAGGVNERASTLHAETINSLTTWVRDVCETRGIESNLGQADAPGLCGWLIAHIDTIANHQAADEFCDELDDRVRQALRIINRPIEPRYVGPCPELVEADHDDDCRIKHPHKCDTALRAAHKADHVICPACGTLHDDLDELGRRLLDSCGDKSFTIKQLYDEILPAVCEYVPQRTLQHWATTGKLIPTGYDHRGEPRFLLGDVRSLRDEKRCAVDGCERKHYANDLCNTHYQRARREASA